MQKLIPSAISLTQGLATYGLWAGPSPQNMKFQQCSVVGAFHNLGHSTLWTEKVANCCSELL